MFLVFLASLLRRFAALQPIPIGVTGLSVKKMVKYFDFVSLGVFTATFIIAIYIYDLQHKNEEMEEVIERQGELLETQRKYIHEVQIIFDKIDEGTPSQFFRQDNHPLIHGPI
jgi:hypothetical protein